jgi:hypothetical protein
MKRYDSTPSGTARALVELGEAWAIRTGVSRTEGIATVTEAMASIDVRSFEKDGETFWCLPEHFPKKKTR